MYKFIPIILLLAACDTSPERYGGLNGLGVTQMAVITGCPYEDPRHRYDARMVNSDLECELYARNICLQKRWQR
jgi:hypothetical protein